MHGSSFLRLPSAFNLRVDGVKPEPDPRGSALQQPVMLQQPKIVRGRPDPTQLQVQARNLQLKGGGLNNTMGLNGGSPSISCTSLKQLPNKKRHEKPIILLHRAVLFMQLWFLCAVEAQEMFPLLCNLKKPL